MPRFFLQWNLIVIILIVKLHLNQSSLNTPSMCSFAGRFDLFYDRTVYTYYTISKRMFGVMKLLSKSCSHPPSARVNV